ncbi:MAG: ABC transporter permease [Methylobacteriaceae bacterium]|nr:ABC transporter permease [Methylobacteriaceae bacterium]
MRAGATFDRLALAAGFAFLYGPILLVVLYSFNESRLVTVWAGFSTRWYGELWRNAQLMEAARVSLVAALASATLATALGTLAALALTRPGGAVRGLLAAMIYAPLVLPEVILGLAFLLLFVALGIERGLLTIILAHATFTMCFVTVIVKTRLARLDRSLEEAAIDLGATPGRALLKVTLPLAAPAIMAGFLLAFTLSLDDFVIASFASGPGATTLPMRIYSQVRLGVTPEVNAISTLLLAAVGLALLAAAALGAGLGAPARNEGRG